jgi:anthranilate phosphoribosyltransferase
VKLKRYIEQAAAGIDLTADEAADALGVIMNGEASDAQIAGLLIALRTKGESVEELVGFARAMLAHAVRVHVGDPGAMDIVGTGGDGLATFNISTVAAFVIAGAGVTVAKHGNRAASGRCGSADVLRALGVGIDISPAKTEECIARTGIGFLFAPVFHPAMKHAARVRMELGVRTIFNLLGPLTNPAGVRRHIIGTPDPRFAGKLGAAMDRLGTDRSCVVCSSDGMDEIGLDGTTRVLEVGPTTAIADYTIDASDFGLGRHSVEALAGGDATDNARIALNVLRGEAGAHRDVVIANAAAGLYVAGAVSTLLEGAAVAAGSIDSGRAAARLDDLVNFTASA